MGHFPEGAKKIQVPSYVQLVHSMKGPGVYGAEERNTLKPGIKTCV